MSVALFLPWAASSSSAQHAAILLLATETEKVLHHSSWMPQLLREPTCQSSRIPQLPQVLAMPTALKPLTSWLEAGHLSQNGNSACLLHSQLISTDTYDTPSTNDCVYPKPTEHDTLIHSAEGRCNVYALFLLSLPFDPSACTI